MTSAEKTEKLVSLNQQIADAAKGRDLSDIPWTDGYWSICNSARQQITSLLAMPTTEVKEPELTLADKMKAMLGDKGGNS